MSKWVKTNDYYNREVTTCDVWSKRINHKRVIYLQDDKDNHFMFTFSCGATSDFSFSGCFFNTKVETLEQAKDYLDKFEVMWFSSDFKGLKKLQQTIEK